MTSSKTDKGGKFLYNILFNYSTILSFSEHTFCHLQCAYFTCTNGNNIYTNHFGRIFIFFVLIYSSLLGEISFNLSLFAIVVDDILNMN